MELTKANSYIYIYLYVYTVYEFNTLAIAAWVDHDGLLMD